MNWEINKDNRWSENHISNILNDKEMLKEQREALEEYNKFKTNQEITLGSRKTYLDILRYFGLFVKKPFKDVVRKDIDDYFYSIKKLKNQTRHTRRVIIKNFFQWLYGMNHNHYPDVVEWMDTTLKEDPKDFKGKEDLLTPEEIERLLNACNDLRDRALIMMILEWGFRASSIKNISMKDVKENDGYLEVFVRGKGRMSGWFTLFDSTPDLKAWLKCHEYKDSPDAPLFYGFLGGYYGDRLGTPAICTMIKRIGKKAKIEKNVFTHLLRHQALTRKGENYTDQELKIIALWKSNTMTKRYIHKDYKDIDQKERRLRGLLPNEISEDETLKRCQTTLDMKTIMQKEKEREGFFKRFDELMPMIKRLVEERKKH
jgi:integrase